MTEPKNGEGRLQGAKTEIPPEARRALAEAEERRKQRQAAEKPTTPSHHKEVNGPPGPEPTRYGDWEKKGIASDF